MNYFFSNWLDTSGETTKIIKYPSSQKIKDTLEETFKTQAEIIYSNFKNLTVFVSGGIDSQVAALAFKKANIPVEYVYLDMKFEGTPNITERFFAIEFAKKYDIPLKILDINYTKKQMLDTLHAENFFNLPFGYGSFLQSFFMKKYKNEHNKIPITGNIELCYIREGRKCKAIFTDPNTGETTNFIKNGNISFYVFDPLIFQHYEHIHRNNEIYQYHLKFEPKNFAYNMLGFNFRKKIFSKEQHAKTKNDNNFTKINFGSDQMYGFVSEVDILYDINCPDVRKKNEHKIMIRNKRSMVLYEFETTIEGFE